MKPTEIGAPLRLSVVRSYEAARVVSGEPYENWAREAAAEQNVPVAIVKRIVSDRINYYFASLDREVQTHSQRVAGMLGASVVEGIQRLQESLYATKKRPLTDKDGRMIRDADGEVQFIETPDWPTIRLAANDLIKLHGGFPAEKIDIRKHTVVEHLTGQQVLDRVEQLSDRLHQLRSQCGGTNHRLGGTRTGRGTPDGDSGRPGPLLLDDPMHQDPRRAASSPV